MKAWMRTLGILAISSIGASGMMSCGDNGGPLPVQNGPEVTVERPTWILDNVKLHYYPMDADQEEYMTEFSLPPEEMIEWCIDGWEFLEGALQSFTTVKDPYLSIEFHDKKGKLLGTTYPYDCSTAPHKHKERAFLSENLGFVHFVVGDDTAILKVQPHLDTITFTCQKGDLE